MALASLLVAIVALTVAIAGVIYNRRQATAAVGALAIEQSRRHDERRPRLSGKVERITTRDEGQVARLVVTLDSNEPLESMLVTIPSDQGVYFDVYQPGVLAIAPRKIDSNNPVRLDSTVSTRGQERGISRQRKVWPGEPLSWRVNGLRGHVETLRVEVTCHGLKGETWGLVMINAPVEQDSRQGLHRYPSRPAAALAFRHGRTCGLDRMSGRTSFVPRPVRRPAWPAWHAACRTPPRSSLATTRHASMHHPDAITNPGAGGCSWVGLGVGRRKGGAGCTSPARG